MNMEGGKMKENTRWQEFNSIIDNEDLQAKEKLLLLTIFRFYNSEKGYSYPSKETIKKLCGITHDRDYYKYIKNLEDKKYLIKETIKGKGCKFYLSNLQDDTHCQNGSDLQNDSNCQNGSDTHCQNGSQPTAKMAVQKENKRKVKENNKKEKDTSLDKIINSYSNDEELINTIRDFLKMRKAIKKPMTDRALKIMLNKLDKYGDTTQKKILVLENSIENSWQGIFPLKENSIQNNIKPNKENKPKLRGWD